MERPEAYKKHYLLESYLTMKIKFLTWGIQGEIRRSLQKKGDVALKKGQILGKNSSNESKRYWAPVKGGGLRRGGSYGGVQGRAV